MAAQDRLAARSWQQAIDQSARDTMNRYQNREGGFLEQQLYGPGGYQDILAGRGGYTPEQQGNLLQENLLNQGMASEGQLETQYLTPGEQASMAGSPYAARDISAGQLQGLHGMLSGSEAAQRNAVDYLEGRMDTGINATNLGMRPDYYGEIKDIIGDTATGYGEIIDPRYLGLSDEFTNRYQVSDRDLQNIRDAAGRKIGLQTQAQNEALMRGAADYGNTNPMALTAAMNRTKLLGDIGSADAALQAEMAARNLQLGTTQNREQMRLGTEQDIAGRATEGLQHLSGEALANAQLYEQMRQDAERDLSNRFIGIGSEVGQAKLATERGIGEAQQQLGQYGTGLVTGLTQYGESEAARRNAELAANRQDVGYQNIGTRWGQRYPASEALSSRYGGVYGQQKAEEQEGRGFLGGQQAAAQEGALTSQQQRIQAYPASGVNETTRTSIFAHQLPKNWQKVAGAAAGFFGGG